MTKDESKVGKQRLGEEVSKDESEVKEREGREGK